MNTLESARNDFLHRASAASLSTEVPLLEIRINASTGDFTARSGQPWWAAAATKGNRIELQPVGILKRRGSLTTTLRHELAHVVIDAVSHNRAPRWLGEGFAIYLAGEGPTISRYATKTKLSTDEIEKRLERPSSQQEMRMLYELAYNQVLDLIRTGTEASVWKKLAGELTSIWPVSQQAFHHRDTEIHGVPQSSSLRTSVSPPCLCGEGSLGTLKWKRSALSGPTHKRIIPNPESPRLRDPLFSIINTNPWPARDLAR